jgi:hypothetical protein
LLVGDDGTVYDVTARLNSNGETNSFTPSLRGTDSSPAQPLLLVAVVSDAPVAAFMLPQPGLAEGVLS